MSVDISRLNKERKYEDEKLKVSFSTGDVSDALSVHIKDEEDKLHHILWEISPDRCNQSFDKTNEKIREFVENKISEWVNEEDEAERIRIEKIQKREREYEDKLKRLMDSF